MSVNILNEVMTIIKYITILHKATNEREKDVTKVGVSICFFRSSSRRECVELRFASVVRHEATNYCIDAASNIIMHTY